MVVSQGGASTGARDHPRVIPFPALPGLLLGDDLCYREGQEGEAPGVSMLLKRGEKRIMGAPVQVVRVASGSGAARYHLLVTLPDGSTVTLDADSTEIQDGSCWKNLDGRVFPLPTTPGELAAMYKALRGLAVEQEHVQHTELVPALGWQMHGGRLLWVAGNGARLDGHSFLGDLAPVQANMHHANRTPYILPQQDVLPSVAPLRELCAFWRPEQSYYYYLALGAVAQVMKPLDSPTAGTANYLLEPIGQTGEGKSTTFNWILRQTNGAGFDFETATLLTDNGTVKDTGPAEARLTSAMRYQAYQAPDRDAKPGTQKYQDQMQRRKNVAMGIGNRDTGGAITDRRTMTPKTRGEPAGLRFQAGEGNPYEWSIANDGKDADARTITIFLPDTTPEEQAARKAHSRRISDHYEAALGAWYPAWVDYLAAHQPELTARDARYRADAREDFTRVVRELGGQVHNRVDEKIAQPIAGLREYICFLFLSGIEGAADLAAEWEALIPAIIQDRAEAEIEMYRQHAEQGTSTPEQQAEQVITHLRLLLAQGHITDKKGGMPEEIPEQYRSMAGWLPIDADSGRRRSRNNSLCWLDKGIVYFYPSPSELCAMLQRYSKTTLSAQRLRELLEQSGAAITGNQKGRNKGVKKIGPDGKYTQRLALRLDALLDIDTDEPEPEPPGDHQSAIEAEAAPTPTAEAITSTAPETAPVSPATQPERPEQPRQPGRAEWFDLLDVLPTALRDTPEAYRTAKAYQPYRDTLPVKHLYERRKGVALFKHLGDTYRHGGKAGQEQVMQAFQQIYAKCEAMTREKQQQAAPGALPF